MNWIYKASYWALIGGLLGYALMNQNTALAESPSGFYSDNRSIEDVREANYLKSHSISASTVALNTSISSLRAIDGQQPAIEISQEQTSPPEGFITLPLKLYNQEKYHGR